MKNSNFILFLLPALIWGSTWYVITYQLGVVDPIVSVAYRFGLAGGLLFLFLRIRKIEMNFSRKEHGFIALQGMLLFGFNYWFVYQAEQYLSSGLVAVAFSTLIFLNLFFGFILLGDKINRRVIYGAIAGIIGTVLIYQAEFEHFSVSNDQLKGLLFCLVSIVFASLGNITSAHIQRKLKLPVLSTNALGMLYGSSTMILIALILGKSLNFDTSLPYILSLIYLAVVGSVIAFTAYLTLIGKIGPGKAAYAIVLVPVIALTISTIFEGYRPDIYAGVGILCIILGNVMALRKKT